MIKEFRLAELIAVVKQTPLLTAQLVPVECDHGMHFQAGVTELLDHLCGEVSPAEIGFVVPAVKEEVLRQHPWLRGIHLPRLESWAWLWAWLDTMEIKYGSTHQVEAMPPDWRGGIKLSSFSTMGLNLITGQSMMVTWEELPEEVQAHLRELGYDETP
jgi:hypothetical protein